MFPSGQLFFFNAQTGSPSCACKSSWRSHYWPATKSCYELESVGPCPPGHFFTFDEAANATGCTCFGNHVLDAASGACLELGSAGDCGHGRVVTSSGCDCGAHVTANYWPRTGLCYPHWQRGPCPRGHVFRPDEATGRPICARAWRAVLEEAVGQDSQNATLV